MSHQAFPKYLGYLSNPACDKVDKDKQNSKRVKDKESGVARGIDFLFVSNVINFDFPKVSLVVWLQC